MNTIQQQNTYKNKKVFILYCMLISMYSMNFLNLGNYIPLILIPVLFIYFTKVRVNLKFTLTIFSLLAFSFTYCVSIIFYGYSSLDAVLGRLLFPSILFMFGYFLASYDKEYIKSIKILFVVIISTSLFGFLSLLKTMLLFGDFNYYISLNGRTVVNLWGDNPINATGLNTSLSLGLVLLPLIFIPIQKLKRSRTVKILCLFCFLITIFTAIQLANRTGLLLVPISFFAVYIVFAELSFKKVITAFTTFVVFIIFYILYFLNTLNVKEYFQSTLMFQRLNSAELSNDPRLKAWMDTFWGIFSNPMGGRKTPLELNFAHNLWLDIALDVGVVPLFLLLIFTTLSLLTLKEFLFLNHPKFLKALVVVLYSAFFVSFMVEPIMQGWVNFFTLFCFILGIMQRNNFEVNEHEKVKVKMK